MQHYTYVGPYLECNNGRGTKNVNENWVKNNLRVITREMQENLEDLLKRKLCRIIDDHYYNQSDKGIDVLIPSHMTDEVKFLKRTLHLEEGDTEFQIDGTVIANELALFEEKLSFELDAVRRIYGTDKVVVKWGIIQYAN